LLTVVVCRLFYLGLLWLLGCPYWCTTFLSATVVLQENARIACGYLWHNLLITSLLEDLLRFFKACRRCLLLPSHLFGFVCCGGVFVISLQPN